MSERNSICAPEEKPEVEYRDIAGFPGYRVGNDGSVWSCRTKHGKPSTSWRRRAARDSGLGYLQVVLSLNGVAYSRYVHRLVLEAFVGPCPEGMQCCHGPDFTRSNNCLSNLRWGTREENDAERRCVKLSAEDVEQMAALRRDGMTLRAIGEKYGVRRPTVAKRLARRLSRQGRQTESR